MARIDIEPQGRFANDLKIKVEKTGMSLTDLAQKVDSTYEHMRKLVAGRAHPSTHLLRALATTLSADRDEWSEMIEADKLFRKYKKLPKFLGISPRLEPFQPFIDRMSDQGRESLLAMAKTIVRQETSHK